jgi:hypothetical protein
MKIAYTLTREDYFQFYLHMREQSKARWRKSRWYPVAIGCRWVVSLALGFTIAYVIWRAILYSALHVFSDDPRVFGGLAAFCTLIALIVYPFVHSRTPKSKYSRTWDIRLHLSNLKAKGNLLIGHRMEIDMTSEAVNLSATREWMEDGISHRSQFDNRLVWALVESIEESELHAFLITKTRRGVFIPKAAFTDVLAFRAFVDEAKRLWTEFATATAITATLPPALAEEAITAKPSLPSETI